MLAALLGEFSLGPPFCGYLKPHLDRKRGEVTNCADCSLLTPVLFMASAGI